jgi:hypothetical protein
MPRQPKVARIHAESKTMGYEQSSITGNALSAHCTMRDEVILRLNFVRHGRSLSSDD